MSIKDLRGQEKNEKGDDKEEEAMEQDPDQAGKVVDKASTGGVSSLEFKFLDD